MGWGRSVTREIGRINQRWKLKGERFLKYIAKEKTAGRFSERELCYGRVEVSFHSSGGRSCLSYHRGPPRCGLYLCGQSDSFDLAE